MRVLDPLPVPPAADPDAPAVECVRRGEKSAFGDIMARHDVPLRRLILGIVADRHLAEDVLQEVFLIAFRSLATFRGDARFSTWIYRIAVREAIRAQSRWTNLCRRFFPLVERELSPRLGAAMPRPQWDLEEALVLLHQLPSHQRAAFVLHVVEGKSYQEVAELLESCPGTVGSWIHRARARLARARARARSEEVLAPDPAALPAPLHEEGA
jgi:RNA polymerase sigma-70 factor (ECF subfamily)